MEVSISRQIFARMGASSVPGNDPRGLPDVDLVNAAKSREPRETDSTGSRQVPT